MSDTIIFIVGAFVALLWGSMVGSLIYAANHPIKRTKNDPMIDLGEVELKTTERNVLKSNT